MDSSENVKREQFKKELRSDVGKGIAGIKRGVLAFQKMAEELAQGCNLGPSADNSH